MGEAKRRKEYFKSHPEAIFTPRGERHEKLDDDVKIIMPEPNQPKQRGKFTANLLKEMSFKHPPSKPRKEMNEEELKVWKGRRNRHRRQQRALDRIQKALGKALSQRKPVENTCRRQRLKKKHSGVCSCRDECCDHSKD